MVNGVQLALDDVDEGEPYLHRHLQGRRPGRSNGDPPAPQKKISTRIIGVVGPTFSGDTDATGPIFTRSVCASRPLDNPALSNEGCPTFHRALPTTSPRLRADRRLHSKNPRQGEEGVRHRRRHRLRQGLASPTGVPRTGGSSRSTPHRQRRPAEADRLHRDPSDRKVKSIQCRRSLLRRLLREAGLLAKELRRAGLDTGPFVSVTDPTTRTTSVARVPRTPRARCCPASAATSRPTRTVRSSSRTTRRSLGQDPGAYSAEAFDVANSIISVPEDAGRQPDACVRSSRLTPTSTTRA